MEDFDSDDMPVHVEIGDYPWFNFPRHSHLSGLKFEIGGIGDRVEFEFHRSFTVSSKYAVTIATGVTVSLRKTLA